MEWFIFYLPHNDLNYCKKDTVGSVENLTSQYIVPRFGSAQTWKIDVDGQGLLIIYVFIKNYIFLGHLGGSVG